MKIFELIGAEGIKRSLERDTYPSIHSSNLLTYLYSLGFSPLGDGAYAEILSHPNLNYVIKIFKSDPCYIEFAKYISANQSNPHLPKIRGKLVTLSKDKNTFGIRIEKLSPLISLETEYELLSYLYQNKMLQYRENVLASEIIEPDQIDQLIQDFKKNQPTFYNLFEDLKKKLPKQCGWDLHAGNFMKRNQTLILIDPWAEERYAAPKSFKPISGWIHDVK